MARLLGVTVKEIEANRVKCAKEFAKEFGVIVVLKGANTVVAVPDGRVFINVNGNPSMATAGSGDVLAGIIVSLLAQGYSPLTAAKSAVYLHGEAGDKAALKYGKTSMVASDIITELNIFG